MGCCCPERTTVFVFVVAALLATGCKKPTPQELTAALTQAARDDDGDAVARALRKGADPNRKDSSGRTPLGIASCLGHVSATKALLKGGADPDLKFVLNSNNFTVMHTTPYVCASSGKHTETDSRRKEDFAEVQHLLQGGVQDVSADVE